MGGSVVGMLHGWGKPWSLILWLPIFATGFVAFAAIGHVPQLLVPIFAVLSGLRKIKERHKREQGGGHVR